MPDEQEEEEVTLDVDDAKHDTNEKKEKEPKYPVPDLGDWNDRAYKYPDTDTNTGFIRYQEKRDDVYLTYKNPHYPQAEDQVFSYYDVIEERDQRKRRLLLGAFLQKQLPDDHRLVEQMLIDMAEPLPFAEFFDDVENTLEGDAMFEALDMATSVLREGGDCIECGATVEEQEDGVVDHKVGCRLVSWMLWRLGHPEEADRTPSMEMVVRAAQEQIARMA